jgi:aconitate hydratase
VIAKNFARIHRRNLISQSILPLLFREEDDYRRISQGDTLKIEGVREAITAGEQTLVLNTDDGTELSLEIRLSPREREVLLAGGTLNFLRSA